MTGPLGNLALRYLHYIYGSVVARRLRAQLDCLGDDHCAVLVDCGCGAGINTERLAGRIGTRRTVGIDISARMLKEAQKERGIAAVRADVNQSIPLQSNCADVIAAMDLLEHLVETDNFVAELHRVLLPGGYAVVATPNLASWHNVFALIVGVQPFSGPNITSMEDADVQLVHRMHRQLYKLPEEGECEHQTERKARRHIVVVAYRSLIRLFERKGFVIEKVLGFGYYPFPPPMARLLSSVDKSHCHHLLIKARKPLG
ncbi:MAG: class I SAM-dependent methyltransferase [Anaerolineae bacterium]